MVIYIFIKKVIEFEVELGVFIFYFILEVGEIVIVKKWA